MAFGLTMGTERATALQVAVQDEMVKRQYTPDQDAAMAEYITIMVINNKTPAQIAAELEDFIGEPVRTDALAGASFVDWLFAEAAKGAPEVSAAPAPSSSAPPLVRDPPPHLATENRRPPDGPRASAPLYQQAISQALPSTSPSGQKRSASARSPSPGGHPPTKSRRTDLPTGPRAMLRDRDGHGPAGGPRSLLDRVGPRGGHGPQFGAPDDVQARIDSITGAPQDPNMMMNGAFPMNGMMDMNAMTMTNPMLLQELMLGQMAMMSQLAGAMGMMNGNGQFVNGGFPMQQPGDMSGFNGNGIGSGGGGDSHGRGRGRGRGGPPRGAGRGRGGHIGHHTSEQPIVDSTPALPPSVPTQQSAAPAPQAKPTTLVVSPKPITPSSSNGSSRPGMVPPDRPQSPTLCKFSLKCTNPVCRYSHPSPVATPESGVVLSNDPCERGKDCKDKDCIKAHVSPAVLNPNAEIPKTSTFVPPQAAPQPQNTVPCRYGAACTRPGCSFTHPRPTTNHHIVPCKFGTACTRATCPFQHPGGRVLPTSFHRGLSTSGPMVNVPTPDAGSMNGPSPHRSVTFKHPDGTPTSVAELGERVKKAPALKNEAETGKGGDASTTMISA